MSGMQSAQDSNLNTIPVGNLGIIALDSCKALGDKINSYIVKWRREREHEQLGHPQLREYARENYLINTSTPRFGSGEGKGVIFDSVRGDDLYILVDVCNYSITYKMRGIVNHMSPDDHFLDLKRVISSIGGKARRITVIMPYLYESRQHKRSGRESLDCAMMLQELVHMGVDNIITFDAHDARVQNAIPLHGFETIQPVYQFIKGLFRAAPDFPITADKLLIVSPDEAGAERSVYMANALGVDMGMFYKRRDYTRTVNGFNPVVAHEFLGSNLDGKDVVILDDMISSGDTMLEVASELKKRGARRIFLCATFGLFTNGLAKFDDAYQKGLFYALLTTNLVYQPPELLEKSYYTSCDMSKFLSLIIDTLNHDGSMSSLLSPMDRINHFLAKHRRKS